MVSNIRAVLLLVMLAWSSLAFSQEYSWVILADSEFRGLPADFRGTVVQVRPGGQTIVVKHDNKDIPFRFDAKRGSAQQRGLLNTVKPGQQIRVRQTKVGADVMYHLDPVKQ